MVCRYILDFHVLILHFETLLKSFSSCNSLSVDALGFSLCKTRSLAKRDSFNSTFPIGLPFISPSHLSFLVRTCGQLLLRSEKSRSYS